MAPTPASVKLTQTKSSNGTKFTAYSVVTEPVPFILNAPFILTGTPNTPDAFVRVATLDELTSHTYVETGLTVFSDAITHMADFDGYYQDGDTLRILTPPAEWGGGTYMDFTISGGGSDLFTVTVSNPLFPSKLTGLSWQTYRGTNLLHSGTAGYVRRNDETVSTFIESQYLGYFDNAADALAHITAVQAGLQSLITAAGKIADNYINYTPGNPIITRITS